MSHLVWYTYSMIIKTDMKENNKANNLREGAIYINANTGTPSRLVNIIPCQGVWLETFDGDGYGEMVKFEDVLYADRDEVEDYLEDHRAYTTSEKAPSHKDDGYQLPPPPEVIHVRAWDSRDDESYVGYYDDGHGNDIRCRD
jgi:hypothetical protein